jgi:hypothetical protein
MKTSLLSIYIVILFLIHGIFCYGQDGSKDQFAQNAIPFTGLTKNLVDLVARKPEKYLIIGSYKILLDTLVDKNISSVFDCDKEINDYLNSTDEPYYEKLGEIIENKIKEEFEDDGSTYVIVDASEENDSMHFSISISRERYITIPILIETKDNNIVVSFTTKCVVKYDFNTDLFIDSNLVNSDKIGDGIKVRINTFAIELKSSNTDLDNTENEPSKNYAIMNKRFCKINNVSYDLLDEKINIDASVYWYLLNSKSDSLSEEDDSDEISYRQISNGEYRWQVVSDSQLDFSISIRKDSNQFKQMNDSIELNYSANGLFDERRKENIELFDEEWMTISGPTICCKYVIE